MTDPTQAAGASRPMSRPGQYWHVHECRWVRYAEPATDEIVVPEQIAVTDEPAAAPASSA
jgi:hypothetical protein